MFFNVEVKRTLLSCYAYHVIVRKFRKGQLLTLPRGMSLDAWPQIILQCLDYFFKLTNCPGMESRIGPKISTKQIGQALLELVDKSRVSFRDYDFWDAMILNDSFDYHTSRGYTIWRELFVAF